MESNEKKGMNPMIMGLIAIVVVGAIAVGVFAMQGKGKTEQSTVQPSPTASISQAPAAEDTIMAKKMAAYKDGIYEVVGNYVSPGGEEELGVTVTLSNNIISDVAVEVKAERPISKKMQDDFAANYKTLVVGKSLDEVNLTKVSGSSLTPKGFNDAIEKIKTEASS